MNNTVFSKIVLPFLFLASLFYIFTPGMSLAVTSSIREDAFGQLNSAAGDGGAGFGSYKDPRETAARIIKIALGLVGTIFITLAVYAGFLWMTAGGVEENITKATGILKMAITGLAIILVSYAITTFVSENLLKSTTENNNVSDVCVQDPTDPSCAL